MGTGIQWTDETWNPTIGCSLVSPGCRNCYAMGIAQDLVGNESLRPATRARYEGTTRMAGDRAVWTGALVESHDQLPRPLSWRKARMVFVNSMSDLFHPGVSISFRDRVYAIMALCPQHTFQILTKRSDLMLRYLTDEGLTDRIIRATYDFESSWRTKDEPNPLASMKLPLSNVWHGVSVEDQKRAEERIPNLLQTPSAIRFLSCEPLLGRLKLRPKDDFENGGYGQGWMNWLDWVIVGGESGKNARPCRIEWIKDVIREGAAAQTPVFVKQLGAIAVDEIDRQMKFKLSPKGGEINEWPENLKVRQWPSGIKVGAIIEQEEESLFSPGEKEAIGLVADAGPEAAGTGSVEVQPDGRHDHKTESGDAPEQTEVANESPTESNEEPDGTQAGSVDNHPAEEKEGQS